MSEVELDVLDLKEFVLSNNSFGPADVGAIRQAISENYGHFGELRDAVGEMESDDVAQPGGQDENGRLPVLAGQVPRRTGNAAAVPTAARWRCSYQARCLFELGQLRASDRCLRAGSDVGLQRRPMQNRDRRGAPLRGPHRARRWRSWTTSSAPPNRPPTTCTSGPQRSPRWADAWTKRSHFTNGPSKPTKTTPAHCSAWHWKTIAWATTKSAWHLYERAAKAFPTGIGALINLGLIYEDNNQFDKAQMCYKRILDCYPDHPQTLLYMKDASATGNMLYDEEAQRRNDRLAQTLNMPVTNFELSVRSRNCLHKMGIETIGDLTRTSEAELLSSKNFGETSLYEIREMLTSKGLSLGQFAHEKKSSDPPIDTSHMSPDEQALLDRPDLRSESVGAGPQVHGPSATQLDRRTDPQDRRRHARVQELRRDQPERSSREACRPRLEDAWRLIH